MQEQPPPLRGYPALDPVLGHGAREGQGRALRELRRADRGGARARSASPAPARRPPGAAPWLLRRRRAVLAAGLLVLAARPPARRSSALTTGGEDGGPRAGRQRRRRDRPRGSAGSRRSPSPRRRRATSPWARARSGCSTPRTRPSRASTRRRRPSPGRFETPGVPSDIAAGAGALWVGNGGGESAQLHAQRLPDRPDDGQGHAHRQAARPDRQRRYSRTFNWGSQRHRRRRRRGLGAQPRPHASRGIDPETGKLVATIDVDAGRSPRTTRASGSSHGPVVTRIDPRTNRVAADDPARRRRHVRRSPWAPARSG